MNESTGQLERLASCRLARGSSLNERREEKVLSSRILSLKEYGVGKNARMEHFEDNGDIVVHGCDLANAELSS